MKQIVCILTIIIIIIVGTERCESSVSWHIRRGRCLLCWPAVAVTWHICLAYQDIIEQCCKRKHTCATYSGVFRIWQRRGPGAEPLVRGSEGRSPLEAETLFYVSYMAGIWARWDVTERPSVWENFTFSKMLQPHLLGRSRSVRSDWLWRHIGRKNFVKVMCWAVVLVVCRISDCYNHATSKRLGRTSYKEQYSYVYRYTTTVCIFYAGLHDNIAYLSNLR